MSPSKGRQFTLSSTHQSSGLLDELTGVGPRPAAAEPAAQARPDDTPAHAPAAPLSHPARPAAHPAEVPTAPAATASKHASIRVHVPQVLADRVRGAVAALAYQVEGWSSLNAATAAALEQFVAQAENAYNGGKPFPWTPGRQLQPGRRVGQ